MHFTIRRKWNALLSVAVTLALMVFIYLYGTPLYRLQIWSGWILFVMIVLLLSYNLRKKLTMLPLGRASLWMQFHAYLGLIAVVMFFQHLSFRMPSGHFEVALAVAFVLTAFSGILGLLLSRIIPKYLTLRGEEVIFERIPHLSAKLRTRVEEVLARCAEETHSKVLFEYYHHHLAAFFFEPKNSFYHLCGSTAPWRRMMNKHQTFCRFLNAEEQVYADQLLELMQQKDDLDYHFALQGLLKAWPFIHYPVSFALLILALLHITLVYAFVGGI